MTVSAAIDPTVLRRATGHFATGITVTTAVTPAGEPVGCTISAFCSLSLQPPLVLVCIGKGRYMHDILTSGPGYAVNVLRADQGWLANIFARPSQDRFSGVAHRMGQHGIPLLDGAIAHIECDRQAVYDGGDHAIVLGHVRGLAIAEGDPLMCSRGTFVDAASEGERATAMASREWLLSAPW
jgi:flavin reductase (DIM6/NTAB) family NADH-FMN oxidoreductase RutF